MCCLIEVVVEVITITIYGVVFYRFYSKRRLRKSMARRDTARSDLYLAQLKSQSAPNTPGLASPRDGGYNPMFSPRFAEKNQTPAVPPTPRNIDTSAGADEEGVRYVDASSPGGTAQPFKLQQPPSKRSTPKVAQEGFPSPASENAPPVPQAHTSSHADSEPQHVEAAPGEQTYDAVPIPGAYAGPAINSPTHVDQDHGYYQAM